MAQSIAEKRKDLAVSEDNKAASKRREAGNKVAADAFLEEYKKRREGILIFNSGGNNVLKGDISTLKKMRKDMVVVTVLMDLCKYATNVGFVFPHQKSVAIKAGAVAFLLFINAGLDKYLQVALCQDQGPEEFQVEHK